MDILITNYFVVAVYEKQQQVKFKTSNKYKAFCKSFNCQDIKILPYQTTVDSIKRDFEENILPHYPNSMTIQDYLEL